MASPSDKVKKLDSRIKDIVRRINSMNVSTGRRGRIKTVGDAFGFDSRFSDLESMVDALEDYDLKGDPSDAEKSKLKKEKQRLKKVVRQKESLLRAQSGEGHSQTRAKKKLKSLSARGSSGVGGGGIKSPDETARGRLSLMKRSI